MRPPASFLQLAFGLAAVIAGRPARAQVAVTGSGVLGAVEHRVISGSGLEATSGTVFGAAASMSVGSRVQLTATALSGTLAASTSAAADQTYASADFRAALSPEPWLALSAGVTLQGFDNPLARQRWTVGRIGAELQFPFVGAGLTGRVGAELLPTVSVSGLDKPQGAYAAASALTWEGGALMASLAYTLERYDFPPTAGFQRHEQLSALTVRVGLRLGVHNPSPGQ